VFSSQNLSCKINFGCFESYYTNPAVINCVYSWNSLSCTPVVTQLRVSNFDRQDATEKPSIIIL